ncbi:MAG: transposase [Lachnospiraceae bacterium]|nr:transposase [Lachnospiraceae bacterium]
MSTGGTLTKTIWQYSDPLPEETMAFLRGIAVDYCKVKNDVYRRYSGIKNLDRLTPVYSILNEMRYCGLRERLNLPAVYYELAIADAVTDIKGSWGIVKNKLRELITANENLSADDRQYLRTILKLNSVYASILKYQEYELPRCVKDLAVDINRLNNLLRRLTRKYLTQPKSDTTDSFRISPNGYSYKDGAMRIVCRVPRKRMAIPLKDDRMFDRQIQVQIKENYVALAVPIETKIKRHDEYQNTVYIYIGYRDMFTLSSGTVYGTALDALVSPETERLARKNRERSKMYATYKKNAACGNLQKAENIEVNNLGKSKYDRQKERERLRTTAYINSEINRMFREQKPKKIVITKPVTKNRATHYSKSVNRRLTRSFGGYIRERLAYKCLINSIELEAISSKGTGSICSYCGAEGKRQGTDFLCEGCGIQTAISFNSARNIEIKYNNDTHGSSV